MKTKNMAILFLLIGLLSFGISFYLWQKPASSINGTINVEAENEMEENKIKGNDFEDYFIDFLHTNSEMILLSKVSDYYKNGKGAMDNATPDLKMSFLNKKFAVECKYRSAFTNNKITWAKEYQVKNYIKFEQETGQKVFIAIGIGGTANHPESIYFVPLYRLSQNFATQDYIQEYKIKDIKECIAILQK